MFPARIAVARPTSAVAAASGDNPRDCPVFEAEIRLFEKVGGGPPGSLSLRSIDGETISVANPYGDTYSTTDDILIGQDIHERWSILTSKTSSSDFVVFTIVDYSSSFEASSEPSSNSELCENRRYDAPTEVVADVTYRPCGVSRVPQETDAGQIVVHDLLGSFLAEREAYDIVGKMGVAHLVTDDNSTSDTSDDTCKWMITFIDWWRWRDVMIDLEMGTHPDTGAAVLIKKYERLLVWDHCRLPNQYISLYECPPGDSGSSGSGGA